jgi:hypothetical protein
MWLVAVAMQGSEENKNEEWMDGLASWVDSRQLGHSFFMHIFDSEDVIKGLIEISDA